MPKLDDASWHSGADDFPEDLPEENAATHIGFFVAWAINKDFWGSFPDSEWSGAVQQVRDQIISGGKFLLQECDGKLLSEMLEGEGRMFAQEYYPKAYLKDFHKTLVSDLQSEYWLRILGRISGKWRQLSTGVTRVGRKNHGGSFGRRSNNPLQRTAFGVR